MNLLAFKNTFFKSFIAILLSGLVYCIAAILVITNLPKMDLFKAKEKNNDLTEGLIYPKTDINVNDIFNVDPLESSTSSESVLEIRKNISSLVFSSLFRENVEGTLQKDLVKEYEFKEGKELKLILNENATWHDGKPVTVKDVIYTLNQIKYLSKNSIYYGAVNGDAIQYEPINDYEMLIKLYSDPLQPRPNIAYLQELTFPILPEHVLLEFTPPQILLLSTTDFAKRPIGSGKFMYSQNEGISLRLQKNENYYGNKVKIDNYTFRLYQDLDTLVKDYTLKKVDILTRKDVIEKDYIDESLTNLGAKSYVTMLKNRNLALYFNLNYKDKENSPFTRSLSLRRSLLKIIDRTKLVESVGSIGREVYGPMDPDSWAFLPEIKEDTKVDLAAFAKTVEDAGYKKVNEYYEKDGIRLTFKLTYLIGETRDKIALEIRDELKAAGIEVQLNKIGEFDPEKKDTLNFDPRVEVEKLTNVITSRDFEVLLTTTNQYQDPDRFNEWHSSKSTSPGINLSGFNSAKADVYLVEGRLEPDMEKRKDSYIKFQRIFMQEVPAIYLMNQGILTYHSPRVKNIELNIANDIEYKYQGISEWTVE